MPLPRARGSNGARAVGRSAYRPYERIGSGRQPHAQHAYRRVDRAPPSILFLRPAFGLSGPGDRIGSRNLPPSCSASSRPGRRACSSTAIGQQRRGKTNIGRPIRIGGQVCGRDGAPVSAGFDLDQLVLVEDSG